jgi:protein SSD1
VLEGELGLIQDTRVQLRAILADNNFTSPPYSEALTRTIPSNLLSQEAIDRDIENNLRRDMRSTRCYTIVDEEGHFLENALSLKALDEHTYEIGLHVSDVTAFIAADSVLDKEARSRGVDVYHTIFEKVPLWPEVLREECTGLVQGQDRLAFSVIWNITDKGEVLDTWYGKTVIK